MVIQGQRCFSSTVVLPCLLSSVLHTQFDLSASCHSFLYFSLTCCQSVVSPGSWRNNFIPSLFSHYLLSFSFFIFSLTFLIQSLLLFVNLFLHHSFPECYIGDKEHLYYFHSSQSFSLSLFSSALCKSLSLFSHGILLVGSFLHFVLCSSCKWNTFCFHIEFSFPRFSSASPFGLATCYLFPCLTYSVSSCSFLLVYERNEFQAFPVFFFIFLQLSFPVPFISCYTLYDLSSHRILPSILLSVEWKKVERSES